MKINLYFKSLIISIIILLIGHISFIESMFRKCEPYIIFENIGPGPCYSTILYLINFPAMFFSESSFIIYSFNLALYWCITFVILKLINRLK